MVFIQTIGRLEIELYSSYLRIYKCVAFIKVNSLLSTRPAYSIDRTSIDGAPVTHFSGPNEKQSSAEGYVLVF
jgi:hypothetical protein